MQKLPLEKSLEAGLYALNITLGERKYYDAFMAVCDIDNATGKQDLDEFRSNIKDAKNFADVVSADGFNDLTSAQFNTLFGNYPFFERRADLPPSFSIVYSVYSTEDLSTYEDQADRIIAEGMIREEKIELNIDQNLIKLLDDGSEHLNLGGEDQSIELEPIYKNFFEIRLDHTRDQIIPCSPYGPSRYTDIDTGEETFLGDTSEFIKQFKLVKHIDLKAQLVEVVRMDAKPIDPDLVYEKVMDVIKQICNSESD